MTKTIALHLIRQKTSLLHETEVAFYAIEAGLAALEHNHPYAPKPYYFAWYLLLATGFERLMKIVVCLHTFDVTGAFPPRRVLQYDIGHDILRLRDAIVTRCYTSEYCQHTQGHDDWQFITHDPVFESLLHALNDFAKRDRYLFMNQISDPALGHEWPKLRWEEIERIALSDALYFRLLTDNYHELARQATQAIKGCIERFVRAIARLFRSGKLGNLAEIQLSLINEFLNISDAQLGTKVYTSLLPR